MSRIKFLVMDVDGTLTDGKLYIGPTGEVFKAFDVKDGYAIKNLLPEYHIVPVIITARESAIVAYRCKELDITEVHQGIRNKVECLETILKKYEEKTGEHTDWSSVAYIGDDVLDLPCIIRAKQAGGCTGCPSDAVSKVKDTCEYITTAKAGAGAVREFIEYIIQKGE